MNIILGHLKRVHELSLRKERNLSECIGYCFTGLVACLHLSVSLCLVFLCVVACFHPLEGHQFVAVSEMVNCLALYFFKATNELRNYSLTTQQRKFFICSFEHSLFLVLQDSWSLGLLVLETR